jgi:pimeloyl-[acyl-carrier protein] methyl ester esterase
MVYMKTVWMRNDASEELLMFFNGWGMDDRIASLLFDGCRESLEGDFLACHDYRSLQPETDFQRLRERYGRITLVAWSLGVWAARHAVPFFVDRAIAINGTLNPVSQTDGIPPEIFEATLSSWSDDNRQRFNRRMCGSGEVLDVFSSVSPMRETAEQKEELLCLAQYLRTEGIPDEPPWQYSHAIIGGRDMIFPASHQFSGWKGVPQTIIADMPHFPLFHFSNLQEVLACLE